MSKRASALGSLFLKTGVSINVFGEVLATRQDNEVPAMGQDFLSCPDKPRCRWSFVQKCLLGKLQRESSNGNARLQRFKNIQFQLQEGVAFFKAIVVEKIGKVLFLKKCHGCNDSKVFNSSCRRVSHCFQRKNIDNLNRMGFRVFRVQAFWGLRFLEFRVLGDSGFWGLGFFGFRVFGV